ncbi:TCF3 fusion partner [Triplophysa dalaica]|uniref:TCF3 fusion partner n=1 Tax=Triplophysa dalaica TaxID=1582913 RepID=UPI0024DFEAA2|nr:TCF3 fusion partner [Triplophysa dalaica]
MMEDFSDLALPPLFGGHILEAELETGGVELGPSGSELLDNDETPSGPGQDGEEERRELDKRKYQALSKRCKEIEQVNVKILGRLHQVQRLTRRLRKERRFLMKTLDLYGDDYRTAQLTIPLEDEGKAGLDSALGADEDSSSPTFPHQSAGGTKKKRHRVQKERDRDAQPESEHSMLTEGQFTGFPSPNSLSH